MTRILAVCLGNICRSPTAEAVIRARAEQRGMTVEVDSAGTGAWHIGDPPHPPAIRAAATRGYDLSALRARRLSTADFKAFDIIVAMDDRNLRDIADMRPAGATAVVRKLLPASEIPDPYYTDDFDGALDLIERGADALLDQLQYASANAPNAL